MSKVRLSQDSTLGTVLLVIIILPVFSILLILLSRSLPLQIMLILILAIPLLLSTRISTVYYDNQTLYYKPLFSIEKQVELNRIAAIEPFLFSYSIITLKDGAKIYYTRKHYHIIRSMMYPENKIKEHEEIISKIRNT